MISSERPFCDAKKPTSLSVKRGLRSTAMETDFFGSRIRIFRAEALPKIARRTFCEVFIVEMARQRGTLTRRGGRRCPCRRGSPPQDCADRLHAGTKRTPLFVSGFLIMFVPSLSWQNDSPFHEEKENGAKSNSVSLLPHRRPRSPRRLSRCTAGRRKSAMIRPLFECFPYVCPEPVLVK